MRALANTRTTYVYAALGYRFPHTIDLNIIRTGGVGVGNLLLTWARAEILADKLGARMLNPTWLQIALGPYIRREPDKRTYAGVFQPSSRYVKGVKKVALRLLARKVGETNVDNANLSSARPSMIIVQGIAGLFRPLLGQRQMLQQRLKEIVTPPHYYPVSKRPTVLGVHIRQGDFKILGWNTDLAWYRTAIHHAIRVGKVSSVEVYSDCSEPELNRILTIIDCAANISTPKCLSAVHVITRLSSCGGIVGSDRSTMSMWAAYLGSSDLYFKTEALLAESGIDYAERYVSVK